MRALALALFLSACGEPIAAIDNRSHAGYDEALITWAVERLIPTGGEGLLIRIVDKEKGNWTDNYSGLYSNYYARVVAIHPCLSKTALVHELIHHRLEVGFGDADGNHDDAAWYLERPVNRELADREGCP